jgi:uncharacterized protein (DUF58 family)
VTPPELSAAPGAARGPGRPAPAAAGSAARPPNRDAGTPGLRARLNLWWLNRLPHTDTWQLTQRNVYILPTRAGLAFALTLVLMLVASINYQLNLGYALTFLLAGAGLVSMHLTHNNLRGLTLHLRPAAPVFAGEAALMEVVFSNSGRVRHALALRLSQPVLAEPTEANGASWAWTDVPAQGQASSHVGLVPPQRGWHPVPTLVVETVFPFGLFRAWTLWRPAARVLAWPRPEHPAPALPLSGQQAGDEAHARAGRGSEMDGVRPWKRGDTMRQVVWKKVARSGEMVSRETAGSASRELWLDWHELSGVAGTEARLSRLTAWALAAEREGLDYGLRLPGRDIAPSQGEAHQRQVLQALATWP